MVATIGLGFEPEGRSRGPQTCETGGDKPAPTAFYLRHYLQAVFDPLHAAGLCGEGFGAIAF